MNGTVRSLLLGLCLLFNLFVCFGVPIGGYFKLREKGKHSWKPFIIGAAAFFVSQICLRIPILHYVLPSQAWFLVIQFNPWEYGAFLGITAGIFEECARFICIRYFLKQNRTLKDGFIFGLGHGGIEAILLVGVRNLTVLIQFMMQPEILNGAGYLDVLIAGLERIGALMCHLGCTLVVLNGINRKQGLRYTVLAILFHAIIDSGIVILPKVYGISSMGLECYMIVNSAVILIIGLVLYKFYQKSVSVKQAA